jgi:hypothetical protein
MKNRSFAILTILIVLLQAVPHVPAQSVRLEANIPFEFVAGSAPLPAGQYHIEPMGSHVVRIWSADSRSSAFFQTIGVQTRNLNENGKLVFNRYGNTYLLSQIWSPGSHSGRELMKSRLERRLAEGIPIPHKQEVATRD